MFYWPITDLYERGVEHVPLGLAEGGETCFSEAWGIRLCSTSKDKK